MKVSESLEQAKGYLWDGRPGHGGQEYLCGAIQKAYEAGHIGLHATIAAHRHIEALLGRHPGLRSWLVFHHDIDPYSDMEKMQATRLAWLNDMIKHFQSLDN